MAAQIASSGAQVIAVHGYTPEQTATALAMISRTTYPILKVLAEVTGGKALEFFEKYFVNYGHASIADMATIVFVCEGISQISAWELWFEYLAGGQEKSTRYGDFGNKSAITIPPEIILAGKEDTYMRIAEGLLVQYRFWLETVFERYRTSIPKPDGMSDRQYESTLRARAFDVARYWLFGGIKTTVAQVMSIRILERQLCRMMASPYSEVRKLAEQIRVATMEVPPHTPEGMESVYTEPVAASLVRHIEANQFLINLGNKRYRCAEPYDRGFDYQDLSLVESTFLYDCDPLVLQASLLVYEGATVPLSYIMKQVAQESRSSVEAMIHFYLQDRGPHDELPLAMAAARECMFEVRLDRGAARDFHRHRAGVQLHQRIGGHLGFAIPDVVVQMGLDDRWAHTMRETIKLVDQLRGTLFNMFAGQRLDYGADYLYPFACRQASIYAGDTRAMTYLCELRTKPAGHFSYREAAWMMWQQMCERFPWMESEGRAIPFAPDSEIDIFQR